MRPASSSPAYSDVVAFCKKYAATEDNVVTAEVATVSDLADLMADQMRKVYRLAPDRPAGRQELTCAADVAEALAGVTREADKPSDPAFLPAAFYPAPLVPLVGIPVIVSPDSAPGTWRLVTHDHCEVKDADDIERAWVSHAECSITAEGCLA